MDVPAAACKVTITYRYLYIERSAQGTAIQETLYLLGSVSASLLLVGHGGWLLIRWSQRLRSRRQDRELADQLARLQQDLSTQLEAMRGYIGSALEDVHERLDSAEHILANGREAPVDGKRY